MHTYYAVKTGPDCYDMRQTKHKERLAAGAEHPHDVCAFGFTADQLRTLVKDHGFDCDLSAIEDDKPTRITLRPQELKPGCVPLNSNTVKHLRVGKGEDE